MPYFIDPEGNAFERMDLHTDDFQEPAMTMPTRPHRAPRTPRFAARAGRLTRMIPKPIREALTWAAVAFIGLIIAAMICGAGLAAAEKISDPGPSISCR